VTSAFDYQTNKRPIGYSCSGKFSHDFVCLCFRVRRE